MPRDQMLPPTIRTPQFPLKTRRQVLSDEEIAQAHANVKKYPTAKKVADGQVVSDAKFQKSFRIGSVGTTGVQLAAALPENHKFRKGDTAWIVDLSAGDTLLAPSIFSWRR